MNAMQQDLHDLGRRLWPDDSALRPRLAGGYVASGRHSKVATAAVGAIVFVLVFSAIAVSIILTHSGAKAPTASANPSADAFVSVEIPVAVVDNPLTVEVARGATLALHLHFTAPTPASPWGVETTPDSDADFTAVQVAYPGPHPTNSPTDFYVAFQFPSTGMTQIAIDIPVSCSGTISCPPPSPLIISIRSVDPPIRTATITGTLTPSCPAGITSVPASCSSPEAGVVITFRDQHGTIVRTTTDASADYFAELPAGTWTVATVPKAVAGQRSSFTVTAGEIVIADIKVQGCVDDAPTEVGRC